jgi:hypothetical protein
MIQPDHAFTRRPPLKSLGRGGTFRRFALPSGL